MISATDYQTIICLIDSSVTDNLQASNTLLAARQVLANMTLTTAQSGPLSAPMDTELFNLSLLSSPSAQFTAFLTKLQKHVDTHYGLTQFLTDNSIVIPQQIASLSAALGYTIPSDFIAACN